MRTALKMGCGQSQVMAPCIVSCEWLQQKISKGDTSDIIVIDVSWDAEKNCQEEYKRCHIPGAVYLNILCGDNTDMYPKNIPSKEQFEIAVQEAGINANSHVIIYSTSNFCGYFLSGRGWWSFKYFGHDNVSVLDGGLLRWQRLGYTTTDEAVNIKRGNFKAKATGRVYKSYEDVVNNITKKEFQVCDCRGPSAYSGEDSPGHIPDAKNLPIPSIVDNDSGVLKPVDKLKELFKGAGVDLQKPFVPHCIAGLSSCSVAIAALLCGAKDVYVYHGGFTEWSKRCTPEQIVKSN